MEEKPRLRGLSGLRYIGVGLSFGAFVGAAVGAGGTAVGAAGTAVGAAGAAVGAAGAVVGAAGAVVGAGVALGPHAATRSANTASVAMVFNKRLLMGFLLP